MVTYFDCEDGLSPALPFLVVVVVVAAIVAVDVISPSRYR